MKTLKTNFVAKFLVGFFLLAGLAFWTSHFVVDAASWTLHGGSGRNNMTSFLDANFRNNSPTSGDIVTALYGSGDEGSVYTTNWSGYNSGSCLTSEMSVQYLTGGTSRIPLSLSGNTIYVLSSGTYLTTGTISFDANCIALVGTGKVYLYSTGSLPEMIYGSGVKNIITDNVIIDGDYDGIGSAHTKNTQGIVLYTVQNTTINQLQLFNHVQNGIYMRYDVQNILINNAILFNNRTSILITNTALFSNKVSINNTILFNNQNGLGIINSQDNILNNVISFNNSNFGISLAGGVQNIFQGVYVYNNGNYGISANTTSTGNIFFGDLHVFDNHGGVWSIDNLIGTTGADQYLNAGTGVYLSTLGRGTGVLNILGTTTRDYLVNPMNGNNEYLLNRNSGLSTYGPQTRTGNAPITYSFGGLIGTQMQPVGYTGSTLVTGGSYDATRFPGSTITHFSGSLAANNGAYANTSGITFTITGISASAYRLFGNIVAEKSGPLSTTTNTGVVLSGTDGTKNIFLQLRNGSNRATHYIASSILDTTYPAFTGLTTNLTIVAGGGYYNTPGINFIVNDDNFSGILLSGLNGNTYYSGNFSNGSTITGEGTYQLIASDLASNSTGMIFTIDRTNPLVTGSLPLSGTTINSTVNVPFTWTGLDANMSGYTLNVSGTNYPATATTYTVNNMYNGTYIWYVIATDKAGNTGVSAPMTLILNVPFTGTVTFSGTNSVQSGTAWYTKNPVGLIFRANKIANFSVTGDITSFTGITSATTITPTTLIGTDGLKTLYVTFSTGSETGYFTQQMFLDTTAPSIPTLSTPASGATVGTSIGLVWSTSTDTGVGLSGYRYYVSPTTGFATITTSGFTTSTSATITISTSGTYYRYVQAIDKLNRSVNSSTGNFYCSGTIDDTPDSFSFDTKTNASLDDSYMSSTETISGLTPGVSVLATVTRGSMYINDDRTGAYGYVKNGDTINIEMFSSDEYNTSVTSTLDIGNFYTTYRITTKDEPTSSNDNNNNDNNLSDVTQLQISIIFNTLIDLYPEGSTKTVFLQTLLTQIQSRIDNLENDNGDQDTIDALQYLYDLVYDELGGGSNTYTYNYPTYYPATPGDRHIAPNGKVYMISYNNTTKLYTSPSFLFPKTFTTLEAMNSYIDVNNGGFASGGYPGGTSGPGWNHTVDNTWQASPYTAPNGKIYHLFKTTDNRYAAYNFVSAKYFDTPQNLITHINVNNPR